MVKVVIMLTWIYILNVEIMNILQNIFRMHVVDKSKSLNKSALNFNNSFSVFNNLDLSFLIGRV